MEYRTRDNPNEGLKWGTLMDLYKLSQNPNNDHIVNFLDLPMGHSSVGVPPQYRYAVNLCKYHLLIAEIYRHLASHEQAVQATDGMKGLMPFAGLKKELIWGTAALKHATTWQHVDDEGFGTVITNMVGSKYWVLARHRQDAPFKNGVASVRGLEPNPTSATRERFEHEGVLLNPGSVL
jgi:hypothetical protein